MIDIASCSPALLRVSQGMKFTAEELKVSGIVLVTMQPAGQTHWFSSINFIGDNEGYDQTTLYTAASFKLAKAMETGKQSHNVYTLETDFGRFAIVFQSTKANSKKEKLVMLAGMEALTDILEQFDRLCGVFINEIQMKKRPQIVELFCQNLI